MKNKKVFFYILIVLTITGFIINSCKKDNSGNSQTFLTRGSWQLASVQVFNYVGGSLGKVDTLNVNCDSTQILTFNSNNTCTYTNFDCIPQKASGSWTISGDQFTLMSTMAMTDTLTTADTVKNDKPFKNAKIYNLGQYSLVLQTGDINTFYSPTTKRRIVQYGFVHQISSNQ